jgi:fucose permease
MFFKFVGIERWKLLTYLWAAIPFIDAILFFLSPIKTVKQEEKRDKEKSSISLKQLISSNIFIGLVVVMICSGASEHTMSQWVSMFAEIGLNVSKTVGDLAGPCLFAVMMGLSRIIYPIVSKKVKLEIYMLLSGILCAVSYLLAALSPIPALSFAGCGLCGLSVGIFWPGTVNLSARRFPGGGTAMFAALAVTGNVGGAVGPALVGIMSEKFNSLNTGLFIAAIFPAILTAGIIYYIKNIKKIIS